MPEGVDHHESRRFVIFLQNELLRLFHQNLYLSKILQMATIIAKKFREIRSPNIIVNQAILKMMGSYLRSDLHKLHF